jgi:ribonuclease HI
MSTANRGMWENTEKGLHIRNIDILSDSEAVTKALDSLQINSKLAWECHQSLVRQAKHNRMQLVWVPGHMEIDGNEQLINQPKKAPQIHSQELSLHLEHLQRLSGE